jgi:hypothetical protein
VAGVEEGAAEPGVEERAAAASVEERAAAAGVEDELRRADQRRRHRSLFAHDGSEVCGGWMNRWGRGVRS